MTGSLTGSLRVPRSLRFFGHIEDRLRRTSPPIPVNRTTSPCANPTAPAPCCGNSAFGKRA